MRNLLVMNFFTIFFATMLIAALFLPGISPGAGVLADVPWEPGNIATVAGNGTSGYSGDGGPATSAQLNSPRDVVLDTSGNLFISEYGNGCIRKVDTSGNITTVAGTGTTFFSGDGGPATSAKLGQVVGLAMDSTGNLFIADTSNNRVRKINTSGIINTIAGNGSSTYSGDGGSATAAGLWNPRDIAIDSAGNLFIAESSNNRIRKVNTSGIITTVAGTGEFGSSGDGGAATSAKLFWPGGVAIDSAGDLLIADTFNNRIRKVTLSTGIITNVAGTGTAGFSGDGGPATSATLNKPYHITIDNAGNLFIGDSSSNRIRKIDSAGIITTVAGTGLAGYSGDGVLATTSKLNSPYGVALDNAGNLIIADGDNHRVRKVSPRYEVVAPSVTISIPSNGAIYRAANMPSVFSGTAADDVAGSGLDANSTTFSLKRNSNSMWWNGGTWGGGATWMATSHDAASGGVIVNWDSTVAMPSWADGTYTVQAKARDVQGNTSTTETTFTFDNTPPQMTVSRPAAADLYSGGSLCNITWTASDTYLLIDNPIAIEYFNGTSWIVLATGEANDGNFAWTVPSLNISSAKIRITAVDRAGNTGSNESASFTIDSTIPAVSFTDIPDTVGCLPVISGTSSDPPPGTLDKVRVSINNTSDNTFWNGSAWVPGEAWLEVLTNADKSSWAYLMPILTNQKSYTVKARAFDTTGYTVTATDSFTFQTSAGAGVRGDANGDSLVNALDITSVERIIAGLD